MNGLLKFCLNTREKLKYAGSSTKFGDGGIGRSQSPYAWSKATNTELVVNYGRWFKIDYAITYFYNVYGPREIALEKIKYNQKKRFTKEIINHFNGDLKEKTIGILGWAFKANTNDTRESPSIDISLKLLSLKSNLIIYDPMVKRDVILKDLGINKPSDKLIIASNLTDLVSKAEAIVILTPWEEFSQINTKKPIFCGHPQIFNFSSKTQYTIGKSK